MKKAKPRQKKQFWRLFAALPRFHSVFTKYYIHFVQIFVIFAAYNHNVFFVSQEQKPLAVYGWAFYLKHRNGHTNIKK